MQVSKLNINPTWRNFLSEEFAKPYFKSLIKSISDQRSTTTIYPEESLLFNAFNLLEIEDLKVVILGQDPYHGEGQANGLAFSVNPEMKIPPSLSNIFKELQADTGAEKPTSGDLTKWAEQGVLLLNTILTVRHKSPSAHKNLGWELFTDAVITKLSEQRAHVVFILWGAFAQSKISLIDTSKHTLLKSTHPSPFSAHRGFFGSKPFTNANNALQQHNQTLIDWRL